MLGYCYLKLLTGFKLSLVFTTILYIIFTCVSAVGVMVFSL